MWRHTISWSQGTSSGTMPDPVSLVPTNKFSENIFKTKGGNRRRKRKGVWGGCKIRWILGPSELAALDALVAAENADTDAAPFQLCVDGTTYRRAAFAKEPDPKPAKDTNSALDVTLEFEFYARLSAIPSPIHLGVNP